jgi:N utilization substance protein B
MNSRRKAREAALQALYQCDTLEDWSAQTVELYFSLYNPETFKAPEGVARENVEFSRRVIAGVIEHLEIIDRQITLASTHWSIARMSRVDRNIIRCATYEFIYASDIPVSVTINEAIEVSKRYGTADSQLFVNGVLDKIASNLKAGSALVSKVASLERDKKIAVND